MKMTPLNIVMASLLVWYISEWGSAESMLSWTAVLALGIMLLVVDLFFRMYLKTEKRLWLFQLGFILLVSIIVLLIKVAVAQ